jgi:hypothetical protein
MAGIRVYEYMGPKQSPDVSTTYFQIRLYRSILCVIFECENLLGTFLLQTDIVAGWLKITRGAVYADLY